MNFIITIENLLWSVSQTKRHSEIPTDIYFLPYQPQRFEMYLLCMNE